MAAKLADELLHMILAPSLTISQEQFKSSSITAFGRNDAVSSSSVLLVCKRWLRVATPLLYEAVVIRSTGQSQSLAETFRQNPAFSQHVKKIRLEGAYASLGGILTSCTNMKTLVILLRIYSESTIASLCYVLPLIDPTDVTIHDEWQIDNRKIRGVFIAFCNAIPKWKNLTEFGYPYYHRMSPGNACVAQNVSRRERLIDALTQSTSIRFISSPIPNIGIDPSLFPGRLALIPSITLRFTYNSENQTDVLFYKFILEAIFEDSRLSNSAFEFVDMAEVSLPQVPSPPQIPTKGTEVINLLPRSLSASSVPKHIWTTIFSFATIPGYPDPPNVFFGRKNPQFSVSELNTTRNCLSLVCKTFEVDRHVFSWRYWNLPVIKEIMQQISFSFPLLYGARSFQLFVEKVLQNPSLGSQVRVLSLTNLDMNKVEEDLCSLIPHLTCLRHIVGCDRNFVGHDPLGEASMYISTKTLLLLSEMAGSTLTTMTKLKVSGREDPLSPSILESYKKLDTLDITSYSPCLAGSTVPQADSLHTLRELRYTGHSGFIDTLSTLRLPQLRSVTLGNMPTPSIERFVKACGPVEKLEFSGYIQLAHLFAHAPKLQDLRWTLRLENWQAKQAPTLASALSLVHGHENLVRFTLADGAASNYNEREQSSIINSFFSAIDLGRFPRLEEITFGTYTWPVEERAISKDPLPNKAILIKQQYGIEINDKSGKPWRQRTHSS